MNEPSEPLQWTSPMVDPVRESAMHFALMTAPHLPVSDTSDLVERAREIEAFLKQGYGA